MTYSIQNKVIVFASGAKMSFAFPIAEAIETPDSIVIRLEIPPRKEFNENVFAFDYDGKQLWQVKPIGHQSRNNPYVGLSRQGPLVRLHGYDGMLYDVDPKTGYIVSSLLGK